jgi:hypothetical protein
MTIKHRDVALSTWIRGNVLLFVLETKNSLKGFHSQTNVTANMKNLWYKRLARDSWETTKAQREHKVIHFSPELYILSWIFITSLRSSRGSFFYMHINKYESRCWNQTETICICFLYWLRPILQQHQNKFSELMPRKRSSVESEYCLIDCKHFVEPMVCWPRVMSRETLASSPTS